METKQHEQPALAVKTMVVETQASASSSRYVGTIVPLHETALSMQSAGRVLDVNCKEGKHVCKGQTLVRIDNTQALHALQTAEAALRQAQDGYDRVKQVHEKGAVTDQKMVEIESQLARARSLRDAAQQQLNECTLIAPCAGVINGLNVEVGQTVVPGVRLLTIMDISALCVRFSVPEVEIGELRAGGENGEVECVAVDTILPIRITEKSVAASPLTHSYEVTARILGGTDILLPGMVGKVMVSNETLTGPSTNGQRLTTNDPSPIIIPAHCILLKPQGPTVWVMEQGTARRRDVVIDGYRANGVLVQTGLHEGDTLILEGYQKLYEGCRVIDN